MARISVELSEDVQRGITALAKRRGVPKSALLKEALEAMFAPPARVQESSPANFLEAAKDRLSVIRPGSFNLAANATHPKRYATGSSRKPKSFYDAVKADIGIMNSGLTDLSTNKSHFDDFGK